MKAFYSRFELAKYPNVFIGIDVKNVILDYFKPKGVPYVALYDDKRRLMRAGLGRLAATRIKHILDS
jgi:hypothetical protein